MNKAVIFDMDGTIIDSIPSNHKVWNELLEPSNINLSLNEFLEMAGEGDFFKLLYKKGFKGDKEKTLEKRDTLLLAKFEEKAPPLIDGFPELFEDIRDFGLKTAIATSKPRVVVDAILKDYSFLKNFDEIVTGDDVTKSKPAPNIFSKAAKKLGVHPQNCLVFEDSPAGIKAAKAADMHYIALATTYSDEKLEKAGGRLCRKPVKVGSLWLVVSSKRDYKLLTTNHEPRGFLQSPGGKKIKIIDDFTQINLGDVLNALD